MRKDCKTGDEEISQSALGEDDINDISSESSLDSDDGMFGANNGRKAQPVHSSTPKDKVEQGNFNLWNSPPSQKGGATCRTPNYADKYVEEPLPSPQTAEHSSPAVAANHTSSTLRKRIKRKSNKSVCRSLAVESPPSAEKSKSNSSFVASGALDESIRSTDCGPVIVRCEEGAASFNAVEKSRFAQTEPLWRAIELPSKEEFKNDVQKLQRVKTSLLRLETKVITIYL